MSGRLMHRRIAPKPPRLLRPERLRHRTDAPAVPVVERRTLGGIGDGGADDEERLRYGGCPNLPAECAHRRHLRRAC